MPESPPEQVRTARPPDSPRLGRARGSARTRAASRSPWGSRTQVAPASSTSARKARWSPATAPVCAAAASAPARDSPTFSTATPTLRSAQSASDSASLAPSPSSSRNSAIERIPSLRARAASQSPASRMVWLPAETRVWKSIPRREPIALTARLPLWVIIPTGPGRSSGTESPQRGARAPTEMIPLPLGPQSGIPALPATSASSRSSEPPPGASPKPAAMTIAPRQPRSAASAREAATLGAGMAKTTASTGSGRSDGDGTQSRPCTVSLVGWTPQTGPANPARSRLRITVSP